jgi:hypothetical protein
MGVGDRAASEDELATSGSATAGSGSVLLSSVWLTSVTPGASVPSVTPGTSGAVAAAPTEGLAANSVTAAGAAACWAGAIVVLCVVSPTLRRTTKPLGATATGGLFGLSLSTILWTAAMA